MRRNGSVRSGEGSQQSGELRGMIGAIAARADKRGPELKASREDRLDIHTWLSEMTDSIMVRHSNMCRLRLREQGESGGRSNRRNGQYS